MSGFDLLGRAKRLVEDALLQHRYRSVLLDLFHMSFPNRVPREIMNYYSKLSTDQLAEDLSHIYPLVVNELNSNERQDFVEAYFKYRVYRRYSNELAIRYAKLDFILSRHNLNMPSSMEDIHCVEDNKDLIDFAFALRNKVPGVIFWIWEIDGVKSELNLPNVKEPFKMELYMVRDIREYREKSGFYAFARRHHLGLGLDHERALRLLAKK